MEMKYNSPRSTNLYDTEKSINQGFYGEANMTSFDEIEETEERNGGSSKDNKAVRS